MTTFHRLIVGTLLLTLHHVAHAGQTRIVVRIPAYPEGDMPEKEKVMSTLASYALWPVEDRHVADSKRCYEYQKYCDARWKLTAWDLRDSEHLPRIIAVRKAMRTWSDRLAPVASSRNGCIGPGYYRDYWKNDVKLEDALAAVADNLLRSEANEPKIEQDWLDRFELGAWSISPYRRMPGEKPEDDPVNVKDFANNKKALVTATQRLAESLKELPYSAAYPLLEELRRTMSTLND